MTLLELDEQSKRQQLEALYTSQLEAVYGFVLARCGSAHLAEDITTETFINAADRFVQSRGNEVTPGWLITVARRRLIDHWRRKASLASRVERLEADLRQFSHSDLPPDSDGRAMAALHSVSERQRAALTLRYLDEYSVSEVADALEISYQAAESLLARGRASFARSYEAQS